MVKGTYQSVEKVFLYACSIFLCYIVSGILVKPDWKEAAIYSVIPTMRYDPGYITMLIGMVEKGITAKEYAESRIEVVVGCIVMSVIAFFIIVACAGAIWSVAPRDIKDSMDAALGLRPFGEYASLLFCAGLLNASLFAACIQPLSTASTVCEGLGFESGINKRFSEAPIFYWLFTLLNAMGAGVVLLPKFPLVRMILFSQVLVVILLPFVLIYIIRLINKKELMRVSLRPGARNAVMAESFMPDNLQSDTLNSTEKKAGLGTIRVVGSILTPGMTAG